MRLPKPVFRILDIFGHVSTAYQIVALAVALAVGGLAYLEGMPFALIIVMTLGMGVIMLILFHRVSLMWAQRPTTRPELLEGLGLVLNDLRDAALAIPVTHLRYVKDPDKLIGPQYSTFSAAHVECRKAIEQIRYDEPTWMAANDYRNICCIIADDAQKGDRSEENRKALTAMHGQIMRSLTNGKRVDRSKITLPDWILENDRKR